MSLVERVHVEGGRIARLTIQAGKGNVLTAAVIAALDSAFREAAAEAGTCAVVLCADGPDFSFGASVPEHAPGEVEKMLPGFHQLFRTMAGTGLPVVAAVRGRCLGGAAEVVIACHHVVVTSDAKLGFPEVTLGVFPPVAAALLPLRVPQPVVDRMVGLGEIVSGTDAVTLGLADELSPDVEERAHGWAARYAKLSGTAVRFATRAARASHSEALGQRLERLERTYLQELMATHDAREGIRAFLERRAPQWTDR